jgi:hypothetical protein
LNVNCELRLLFKDELHLPLTAVILVVAVFFAHFFPPFFAALVVVRLRVPFVAEVGASSGLAFGGLPG